MVCVPAYVLGRRRIMNVCCLCIHGYACMFVIHPCHIHRNRTDKIELIQPTDKFSDHVTESKSKFAHVCVSSLLYNHSGAIEDVTTFTVASVW